MNGCFMRLSKYTVNNNLLIIALWIGVAIVLGLILLEAWQQYHAIEEVSLAFTGNSKQIEVTTFLGETYIKKDQKTQYTLFGDTVAGDALKPSLRYKITGIFISPGGQFSSAVLEVEGGVDQLIGVGDDLPNGYGEVTAIYSDRVIITINGQREIIPLAKFEEEKTKGPQMGYRTGSVIGPNLRESQGSKMRVTPDAQRKGVIPNLFPQIRYSPDFLERMKQIQEQKQQRNQ